MTKAKRFPPKVNPATVQADAWQAAQYTDSLAQLLEGLESDPEALSIFETQYPQMFDDIAAFALQQLALQHADQAARLFYFLLQRKEEALYHLGYGESLAMLGHELEAAHHFHRAIELAPLCADAYFGLAVLYLRRQQPQHAQQTLDAMLSLNDITQHPLAQAARQKLELIQSS